MKLDIQVTNAIAEQAPIIAQLCELYSYEMTDLADFDIRDDGFYGYDGLSLYWDDPNKYPFLIWVNQKLAGFVLIQKGSPFRNQSGYMGCCRIFYNAKISKKKYWTICCKSPLVQF